MDSSAKHPSTVFSVVTRRHATEEGAIVSAISSIYEKLAAHRMESPNTVVVSLDSETASATGYGYSARVSVVVRYLV